VTGFKKPNVKQLMLFSGRAYPELAQEIAGLMGVDIVATRALNYANSEIYVRF
jgi:ribose-phosphate pyrophosphokinase